MRAIRPGLWLTLAVGSLCALAVTFVAGLAAPSKDIDETCAKAGQVLDYDYREAHRLEPGRFFPMHNRCNANYDMIPRWINPALVVFAVLTVALLVGFVISLFTHRIRRAAS